MSKRGNQSTVYKQVCLHTRAVLKYVLFTVFALFYILAPYYVPSLPPANQVWTSRSLSSDVNDSSSKSVVNPYHSSIAGSAAVNFIKEDSKDDESRLFWVDSYGFKFLESCIDLLYIPIKDLIQSRHPIPLFVLYHTWKSFLLS